MFDVGFGELVLVALLALIIAGPERLPVIMRSLGRWAGRARNVVNAVRSELEREAQRAEDAAHNALILEKEKLDGDKKESGSDKPESDA